MILQILTSVKEITLVTWMLHAWTPLDHMYVNVTLDILEMDKTAQVKLISSLPYVEIVLHDTFNYSAAPFSRVARQLDNLSMRNSAILSSLNIEESNTQMRVDMEFLFECSTRYLMSESSKRVRYRAREYRLNYNLLVSSWTWEEKVHNCKQTYIILFII